MIEEILTNKYTNCLTLDLSEDNKSIILHKIFIEKECRGEGIATDVMNDLIDYADRTNKEIYLTPSNDWGSSVNRLIQFYKRFGFRMTSREEKQLISYTMIRKPIQPGQKRIHEDKIKGGKADKMSKKDIADKFGITVDKIEKEIEMGIKVELEHTDSKKLAKEIAMDHLTEIPDYYTRLKKMEKEGEKDWKESIKENLRNKLKKFI